MQSGGPLLGAILPRCAVVRESHGDRAAPLWAGEAALVARAVPARRREFATTRACARAALGGLGLAAQPLLRGREGAPIWPAGVVGSLTHCAGYRAAAVADARALVGLGVDAEPNAPLPGDVLAEISLPAERAALPTRGEACWDRLLFSAKEAVYKAWSPLGGSMLDFTDLAVAFDAERATFSAVVRPEAPGSPGVPRRFAGRWRVGQGLVLTAAIPRCGPP